MNEDLKQIYAQFDGKLIGSHQMVLHVCQTLAAMPPKTIAYITKFCWFLGSMEDAWAFTFTGNDLKNQHLIFLSDELLTQPPHLIHWTIAHEVGHVMLGHRNAILAEQSKEEIAKQEKQADDFARKYVTE